MLLQEFEFKVLELYKIHAPLNPKQAYEHFRDDANLFVFRTQLNDVGKTVTNLFQSKILERAGIPNSSDSFRLSANGEDIYNKNVKGREELAKIANLNNRKLTVDVANAERVYKSYGVTRVLAWIGSITAVILFLLKIAEYFNLFGLDK